MGYCDECGGQLLERDDDQVRLIDKRVENYLAMTVPVAELLRASSIRVVECNAMEPPASILAVVLSIVTDRSVFDWR